MFILNTGLGVITDRPSVQLPNGAWDIVSNVRFKENSLSNNFGWQPHFAATSSAVKLFNSKQGWLSFSSDGKLSQLKKAAPVVLKTLSPSNYADAYDAGIVTLFTNGVDKVQAIYKDSIAPFDTNLLARFVMVFKNRVLLIGVTEGGVYNPNRVIWSDIVYNDEIHKAKFDYTDPKSTSGDNIFDDTEGEIRDVVMHGDTVWLFKDRSIIQMNPIGGLFVFGSRVIYNDIGIMSPECAVSINSNILVLTRDDVVLLDGQSVQSLVTGVVKTKLFGEIVGSLRDKCRVLHNPTTHEVTICFATVNELNRALVWNYEASTFSFITFDEALNTVVGIFPSNRTLTYDNVTTETYDNFTNQYSDIDDNMTYRMLIQKTDGSYAISDFATSNKETFAIRSNIDLFPDDRQRFLVTEVWPVSNGEYQIQVGMSDVVNGAVTWSEVHDVDDRTGRLCVRIKGRYMHFRVIGVGKEFTVFSFEMRLRACGRN